jgi:hypothetical protein
MMFGLCLCFVGLEPRCAGQFHLDGLFEFTSGWDFGEIERVLCEREAFSSRFEA